MSQPGLDEVAYDETAGNTDVVFSDQNGFTMSLPANSPSAPSNIIADDIISAKTKEDDTMKQDRKREEGIIESETSSAVFPTKDCSQNDSEVYYNEEVIEQGNTDPHFLPPLITEAIKQKSLEKLNIKDTRDKNLNITHIATNETDSLPSGFSTEEEFEENVYLENAGEIFDDLVEKEFLGVPKNTPTPDQCSDDGSHVTKESIDPIENILVREDDVTADNRTFTLNGRAVITPKSSEKKLNNQQTLEQAKASNDVTMSDEPELTPQDVAVTTQSRDLPRRDSSESKTNKPEPDMSDACPDFCCTIL